MDRIELLNRLNALGEHLVGTKNPSNDEMAAGVGIGLLALADLLKASNIEQVAPARDASSAFKAKANRW